MQKPEAVVTAILGRWSREEINLGQLLSSLASVGWTRREVFAYLEQEADDSAGRQALGNRPKPGRLQN
jgi:hypothetical protein